MSQEIKNFKKALSRMKSWAKEKDRRYREQKKFAKKIFGKVVRQIQKSQTEEVKNSHS